MSTWVTTELAWSIKSSYSLGMFDTHNNLIWTLLPQMFEQSRLENPMCACGCTIFVHPARRVMEMPPCGFTELWEPSSISSVFAHSKYPALQTFKNQPSLLFVSCFLLLGVKLHVRVPPDVSLVNKTLWKKKSYNSIYCIPENNVT